jgi:hypothetical protein
MNFIEKYCNIPKLYTITPSNITPEEQSKKFKQKRKEKEIKLLHDMNKLKINHKTF